MIYMKELYLRTRCLVVVPGTEPGLVKEFEVVPGEMLASACRLLDLLRVWLFHNK